MTKHQESCPIKICVDCLFILANGESESATDEWLSDYLPRLNGREITLGDGEGHFSWKSCQGCGSRLGGDRFEATEWFEVTA